MTMISYNRGNGTNGVIDVPEEFTTELVNFETCDKCGPYVAASYRDARGLTWCAHCARNADTLCSPLPGARIGCGYACCDPDARQDGGAFV